MSSLLNCSSSDASLHSHPSFFRHLPHFFLTIIVSDCAFGISLVRNPHPSWTAFSLSISDHQISPTVSWSLLKPAFPEPTVRVLLLSACSFLRIITLGWQVHPKLPLFPLHRLIPPLVRVRYSIGTCCFLYLLEGEIVRQVRNFFIIYLKYFYTAFLIKRTQGIR